MTSIIAMMCAVAAAACSQSRTSTTNVSPTIAAPSDAAIEAPTADGRVIFDTVCDNPLAKGC